MIESPVQLVLPPEPTELRAQTRALLEQSPDDGMRLIDDARFLADVLWSEWCMWLSHAGMNYERFLEVVRGYRGEIRLWALGERTWTHCSSGLAGRTVRRLPAAMARVA